MSLYTVLNVDLLGLPIEAHYSIGGSDNPLLGNLGLRCPPEPSAYANQNTYADSTRSSIHYRPMQFIVAASPNFP